MESKLLTLRQVAELVSLSRTTIWRLERSGRFPRRLQVSTKAVRWNQAEIFDWIESRPLAGELENDPGDEGRRGNNGSL